ncbi:hypothetical protein ACFQV2_28940 [Actinokineospora soli]|uniref:Uncharacterized protein n=1 Tax=Actinokineospora soli TaxID=1048753 RepID=A0ABW2TU76_9PSEU
MLNQSFASLGLPTDLVDALAEAGIDTPSPSRPPPSPTPSPGATCWAAPAPAPARRWRSACRC